MIMMMICLASEKRKKRGEKRNLACLFKEGFGDFEFWRDPIRHSLSLSLCCLFGVEISECEAVIYAQDAF